MKKTILNALVVASVLAPAVAFAQAEKTKPTTATYIMKDEIDQVSNSEQSKRVVDENTKVVDLGYENFTVGVIHRASTRNPPPPAAGRGKAAASKAPAQTCGRQMATLPPGGIPGGIVHDFQTEGYYIISGGGTMFTDGYIVNGRHGNNSAPGGPNGPTCGGMAYEVRKVVVKARRRCHRPARRGARMGRHPRSRGLFELPAVAERPESWLGESDHHEMMSWGRSRDGSTALSNVRVLRFASVARLSWGQIVKRTGCARAAPGKA